jgi:hypothetical protein
LKSARFQKTEMNYCFDTSAIGARHAPCLYDDQERSVINRHLHVEGCNE